MNPPKSRQPARRKPSSLLAASLLLLAIAANAEESETRLGEMKVSSDADKPVQARTELGKLTEYTPISGRGGRPAADRAPATGEQPARTRQAGSRHQP
jgi:hypothetical protein